MAISDYSELQTAVQNLFDDSVEISSDRVQEHIDQGEALINLDVRAREMETTEDLTISTTKPSTTSLPTGFLAMRRIYINTDPIRQLKFVTPIQFWASQGVNQTGTPEFFTIEGDSILMAPTPSAATTGKQLFYKRSDIASTVPALFTNNPHLYVYAAGIFTASYLEDRDKELECTRMYDELVKRINRADSRDRFGGASLQQRSDVHSLGQ